MRNHEGVEKPLEDSVMDAIEHLARAQIALTEAALEVNAIRNRRSLPGESGIAPPGR